jgi:DNA polymerase/3'-5' exonuclease PolX
MLALAIADKLAARILAELAPFCDQCEIAGSIRRRRPYVNDIDIVALPKRNQAVAFVARVKQSTAVVKDGAQELVVRLRDGTQLDVWIANPGSSDLIDGDRPTNYGSLLLCRTGSAAHNIFLIEQAKKLGLRWNPHHGVFSSTGNKSQCLASITEEDIFRALNLEFVPPEKRER